MSVKDVSIIKFAHPWLAHLTSFDLNILAHYVFNNVQLTNVYSMKHPQNQLRNRKVMNKTRYEEQRDGSVKETTKKSGKKCSLLILILLQSGM